MHTTRLNPAALSPAQQEADPPIAMQIAETIITTIRPLIERDGGSISFKEFRDGIVYVELAGACHSCSAVSLTLKSGVERLLRRTFREVRSVELWQQP